GALPMLTIPGITGCSSGCQSGTGPEIAAIWLRENATGLSGTCLRPPPFGEESSADGFTGYAHAGNSPALETAVSAIAAINMRRIRSKRAINILGLRRESEPIRAAMK